MTLTKKQKIKLVNIARTTMEKYIKKNEIYVPRVEDPVLNEKRGVFVTLKSGSMLRGCIGSIMPENKLYLSVRDMTVKSSVSDPRFMPVTAEEIDNINIEISVLSIPEEVSSPEQIKIPGDGVIVKKDGRAGVYLPQVAYETGWTKEQFLNNLCESKAGLKTDAWKDPKTHIFSFRAEVFNEKELIDNE
ncbi:MAG: AmmeMemoRadiSam system protein A [Elusimicrobiota bacterium]